MDAKFDILINSLELIDLKDSHSLSLSNMSGPSEYCERLV